VRRCSRPEAAAALAVLLALAANAPLAALYKWVDEKGRVQYSDKPPEKENKGSVEMSNRGVVMKRNDPAATAEQKKAQEEVAARKKLEDQKAAEQRRQDDALLQSYTTEKEIDLKRDREIQVLEASVADLRSQSRAVNDRIAEDRKRAEGFEKSKKPMPDSLKDELARAENEKKSLEKQVAAKQQEITATRQKYEEYRRRFVELKQQEAGGTRPITPPSAAPASAAAPPAPRK